MAVLQIRTESCRFEFYIVRDTVWYLTYFFNPLVVLDVRLKKIQHKKVLWTDATEQRVHNYDALKCISGITWRGRYQSSSAYSAADRCVRPFSSKFICSMHVRSTSRSPRTRDIIIAFFLLRRLTTHCVNSVELFFNCQVFGAASLYAARRLVERPSRGFVEDTSAGAVHNSKVYCACVLAMLSRSASQGLVLTADIDDI